MFGGRVGTGRPGEFPRRAIATNKHQAFRCEHEDDDDDYCNGDGDDDDDDSLNNDEKIPRRTIATNKHQPFRCEHGDDEDDDDDYVDDNLHDVDEGVIQIMIFMYFASFLFYLLK